MKRINKSFPGPKSLEDYAKAHPAAKWEEMRQDNANGGSEAAQDCRKQAVSDQHGLCAYCEQKINLDGPCSPQIEHFHPQSDPSNHFALDWKNMLAVCDGGIKENNPKIKHRSCDAYKNYMIQKKKLPLACEGYLLNPLDIPDSPNLFDIERETGYLKANQEACDNNVDNEYSSKTELVDKTIECFNLNCYRLTERRKQIANDIDKRIEILRKNDCEPTEGFEKLVESYFKGKVPEFFTTIRCLLGKAQKDFVGVNPTALEDYLKRNNYLG
ncbi:MAG: TIGR02646 family protein [Deltaproteobacteria bacterium]|nr:TIGR02646 family protein [Deltaproteobacteria bacterium]